MTQDSREFQIDLVSLVESGQIPGKTLAQIDPAAAIPAGIGVAKPRKTSASAASSSTGIASPLTEPDYTARTWHATRSITDTSGLFTIEYENVEEIVMEDANGAPNEVRLIFADEP